MTLSKRVSAIRFTDLPATAIIRIAVKLEVFDHIQNLRGSCAHARACLSVEGWALVIVSRFGESSRPYIAKLPTRETRWNKTELLRRC